MRPLSENLYFVLDCRFQSFLRICCGDVPVIRRMNEPKWLWLLKPSCCEICFMLSVLSCRSLVARSVISFSISSEGV